MSYVGGLSVAVQIRVLLVLLVRSKDWCQEAAVTSGNDGNDSTSTAPLYDKGSDIAVPVAHPT